MSLKKNSPFSYQLIITGSIFSLALLARLIYFFDIRDYPILWYPVLDLESYHLWALRISRGNWLGEHIFYQSPLYPYFLGLIYKLFGESLTLVYLIQIFFGALNSVVIYLIGKYSFDKKVGILAGTFSALYKPFIFYDVLLLKTWLEPFLISIMLFLCIVLKRKSKIWISFLCGASLGLSSLVRDNFLVLAPLIGLWIFIVHRFDKLAFAKTFFFWLFGLCLVLGVVFLRNWVVGGDLVLITSQGGQNFYIGNHIQNKYGIYQAPYFVRANPMFEEEDFRKEAEKRTGRKDLKPSEVSNFWFMESFREIRKEPALFFKRLARKLALFWNQKEIADNVNFYLVREKFSVILKLPLFSFGIIAPFGILGMLIAIQKRKAGLLISYILLYWVAVSIFYIFARYRLAVVPPLIVFASFAINEIYNDLRDKKYSNSVINTFILIAAFVFVFLPIAKDSKGYAYYNLGNSYLKAKRYEKARENYLVAVRIEPNISEFWTNLAGCELELGNVDSAISFYQRAILLSPYSINAHLGLSVCYAKLNLLDKAEQELKKVIELEPENKDAEKILKAIKREHN